MKVVHIIDSPVTGGAAEAARSIYELAPQDDEGKPWFDFPSPHHQIWDCDPPSSAGQAIRTIGGYCDPLVRSNLVRRFDDFKPDLVHLHNFKEWGTAAIAAARDLDIPVVWSCYDYWPLCPRDNGHACSFAGNCVSCYNPRNRELPKAAKLPLLGRRKRMLKWINRLTSVIALTEASRQHLILAGVKAPIDVVPLPITVPLDLATKAKPDRPYEGVVAYAGGENPAKGWEVWKEIVSLLPKFVTCVDLHHLPSRSASLQRLHSSDVLCFPEQWPNVGPVVLAESAMLRTPIVASDIGGVAESAPGASLVIHNEPLSFVDRIMDIIMDGAGEQVAHAYAAAHLRHDPQYVVRKLIDVYEATRRI